MSNYTQYDKVGLHAFVCPACSREQPATPKYVSENIAFLECEACGQEWSAKVEGGMSPALQQMLCALAGGEGDEPIPGQNAPQPAPGGGRLTQDEENPPPQEEPGQVNKTDDKLAQQLAEAVLSPQLFKEFVRRTALVMKDNSFDRYVAGRRRGDLDGRRLYKAMLPSSGVPKVFMKKEERKHKRYNVLILVDESLSMVNNTLPYTPHSRRDVSRVLRQMVHDESLRAYIGNGMGLNDEGVTRWGLTTAFVYTIVKALEPLNIGFAVAAFGRRVHLHKDWNDRMDRSFYMNSANNVIEYGNNTNHVLALRDALSIYRDAPNRDAERITIFITDGQLEAGLADTDYRGRSMGSLGYTSPFDYHEPASYQLGIGIVRSELQRLARMSSVISVGIGNPEARAYARLQQVFPDMHIASQADDLIRYTLRQFSKHITAA